MSSVRSEPGKMWIWGKTQWWSCVDSPRSSYKWVIEVPFVSNRTSITHLWEDLGESTTIRSEIVAINGGGGGGYAGSLENMWDVSHWVRYPGSQEKHVEVRFGYCCHQRRWWWRLWWKPGEHVRCQYPWITRKTCWGPLRIFFPLTAVEAVAMVEAWRTIESSYTHGSQENVVELLFEAHSSLE